MAQEEEAALVHKTLTERIPKLVAHLTQFLPASPIREPLLRATRSLTLLTDGPDVRIAAHVPSGALGLGMTAAIAIPSMVKYLRASKAAEAMMQTRVLAKLVVEHHRKHKKWPPAAPLTPSEGACKKPGNRHAPDAAAWRQPGWEALPFSMEHPHYYRYEVIVSREGANGSVTVRAVGDLDCNGVESAFERTLTVNDEGQPQMAPLVKHRPDE